MPNPYYPQWGDPSSIAKAMALGVQSGEAIKKGNLYDLQTQEEQNKLNQQNQLIRAQSLYDMAGNTGNPADYHQALQDNGIPSTVGQQVANQAQQAQAQSQAPFKQWASDAALIAITAPDDNSFKQIKRSIYQNATQKGFDLSQFGIKSADDMDNVTRDQLGAVLLGPEQIKEIASKRMDMMNGGAFSKEDKPFVQAAAKRLGIPISQVQGQDLLDQKMIYENRKREASLQINGLTPEENKALDQAIANGLDPYKVNSRTAKIYAQQEMQNPGRPWNELAANAAFQRSANTSNTKALLSTIDPLLDKLDSAGKALGNVKSPAANKAVNWFKENVTGDADLTAFKNLRDDTVAEIERGLMGSGVLSDSKYQRAIKNISESQNYQQLQAAIKNTRTVIHTRLEALQTGPYPNASQPTQQQTSSPIRKVGRFTVEVE